MDEADRLLKNCCNILNHVVTISDFISNSMDIFKRLTLQVFWVDLPKVNPAMVNSLLLYVVLFYLMALKALYIKHPNSSRASVLLKGTSLWTVENSETWHAKRSFSKVELCHLTKVITWVSI